MRESKRQCLVEWTLQYFFAAFGALMFGSSALTQIAESYCQVLFS